MNNLFTKNQHLEKRLLNVRNRNYFFMNLIYIKIIGVIFLIYFDWCHH
jgi:hypothetical protein